VPALLQDARLGGHEHGVVPAQVLDDVLPAEVARGGLFIPAPMAEHALGAPGPGVADRLGQLLPSLRLTALSRPSGSRPARPRGSERANSRPNRASSDSTTSARRPVMRTIAAMPRLHRALIGRRGLQPRPAQAQLQD
jgi:hypothetical protein